MNKTLYNLDIKTTKEDKTKVYAIHIIRRNATKQTQSSIQYTYPVKYN